MSTALKRVCLAVACLCVILALPGAAGARSATASSGGWLSVQLVSPVYGTAAILTLGADLAAVAQTQGISASELLTRLETDKHLGVDRSGHLFFADSTLPPAPAGSAVSGAVTASAALAPLEDTFLLHSRPGSQADHLPGLRRSRAVGHGLERQTTTAAATSSVPPGTSTGNASVFTDTERTRIQQVWQRVAEDYAPFDVDVTTEYPGEAAITRSSSADAVLRHARAHQPHQQLLRLLRRHRLRRACSTRWATTTSRLWSSPRISPTARSTSERQLSRERPHSRPVPRRHHRRRRRTTRGMAPGRRVGLRSWGTATTRT